MLKNTGKRTFSEIMDDPTEIFKQRKIQQITSMLSEDGTLKYDFMFSLQKIVIAKIISNLWMNEMNQERKTDDINWEEIKDALFAKISQLSLPNHISQQLQDIVLYFEGPIFIWILYHNHRIFCSEESVHSSADFISDITWTMRGKIDYGQTAKNILANQGRLLSDDCKYKLACMYCLEDEIAVLAPKIIANKFYLSGIPINRYPMIYFWTAHFTGDNTPMDNPFYYVDEVESVQRDRHMSINEYIMLLLLSSRYINNDVPIRYMWNKLNEEEKAKLIVPLVKNLENPDLIFSLFSNIQYDLQQKVFKECSVYLLSDALDEWWWWEEYFLPILHYALDIIRPESYWTLLVNIHRSKIQVFRHKREHLSYQFKSLFNQLWRESSLQFKDFVFQLENQYELEIFLTEDLCWEKDIDIFELFLNDLSSQNKKMMFFEDLGIDICVNLIENDKWDLLELFLKDVFTSEEDINQLKERLVQNNGSAIATRFVKTRAYDTLERFVSWAFKSREEVWKLFKH